MKLAVRACALGLAFSSIAVASALMPSHLVADGLGARTSAGLIAYERSIGYGPSEIWLMNADGTGQRRLTRGCCLDWSPDRRRIAYLGTDGIYVIGVDGNGKRRLAVRSGKWYRDECLGAPDAPDGEVCDFGIDWSPDGRQVAFDGAQGIVTLDIDGAGKRQLTSGEDSFPNWSPTEK